MPELESPTVDATQQQVDAPPTQPFQGTDQDAARRALYEKHYGSPAPGGNEPPADPAAVPSGSTAQVEPLPSVVAPVVATLPPEVLALLQSQQGAIEAMRTQLAAMQQPQATTQVADTTHEPEPSWITALREGRITDAENIIADNVAKRIQQPTSDQATANATERIRAEFEIANFVTEVRAANSDLLPLEDLVATKAATTMNMLRQQGKIKTTEDAVREYKKAVLDSTESVRKIALTLRGQGKTEAAVRSREVLSASTPTPQQTQVRTGEAQSSPDQRSPEQMTSDYMTSRMAQAQRNKGLA